MTPNRRRRLLRGKLKAGIREIKETRKGRAVATPEELRERRYEGQRQEKLQTELQTRP